jgi:hypothetical protein
LDGESSGGGGENEHFGYDDSSDFPTLNVLSLPRARTLSPNLHSSQPMQTAG